MRIVLASANTGKIGEIKELLRELDPELKVCGKDDYPELGSIPEPGRTFADNALYKARYVCRHTRLVALADDSGLEVEALNGAPGVYSARYSGEGATDDKNNAKLLQALSGHQNRRARFCCVLAACAPNGAELTVTGIWEGRIAETPRGEQGFGYDPIFVDLESKRTAAEMSREEKSSRSHRGHALRELVRLWPEFIARAGHTQT
ncbi:RdgB/HAM1 family non-canonical purine NTP pyrophosphatase [Desulfovermiculus halophilus]|jgi:XTP/dITP diphosphohydrolase|uniref:RdgB/HAM1 family non-canonical purine NTP pyrophosphatase n=1 Tax=Desulfovermiculus halophilus TaxID=339722 RepID=UPI000AA3560B|nr:RdgB/HAM1 family non-canonical purine NTP pyrophosphatase [Desulfovermiculus halophilus]